MNIFKKIYYVLKNKFHICKLCNDGMLKVNGYILNKVYEIGYYSDSSGIIHIKCPACHGTRIVWGK